MFKKFTISFMVMMSLSLVSFADEVINDFDEKSVPVLNEELRQIRSNIRSISLSGSQKRVLVWYVSGELETGTNLSVRFDVPFSGTIIKATAYAKTAPVDDDLIIDLNKNGTTLWASDKLTISDGDSTGSKTSFDSTTVSVDDYFTLDVDQVGSTTAGEDLTVQLQIQETITSE